LHVYLDVNLNRWIFRVPKANEESVLIARPDAEIPARRESFLQRERGPSDPQNDSQQAGRMALKVGWGKTLPSRVFKVKVRLEKGKTRLNKSDYLELACFESLCGAFFSNTSTRWRP